MSARDELRREMVHYHLYMTDERADELIDAFAHELAEQQRRWAVDDDIGDSRAPEYGSYENVLNAADLIDPHKPERQ